MALAASVIRSTRSLHTGAEGEAGRGVSTMRVASSMAWATVAVFSGVPRIVAGQGATFDPLTAPGRRLRRQYANGWNIRLRGGRDVITL